MTWEYLKVAQKNTPEEFILSLDKEDSTHSVDIDRFYSDGAHADWMEGRGGYNVQHYGTNPIRIEIRISRYGYSIESVWGDASEEEKRLNRYASAVVGFPAKDYDKNEAAGMDFTTKMIATEFATGLSGMRMQDVREHPLADQLELDMYEEWDTNG